MTIANINPPYGDLPDDYTVGAAEWNGQFDAIFNDRNNVVKPAIDALQSANTGVISQLCCGRLTIQTGQPFFTGVASQSPVNTLYWSPVGGNWMGLWDNASSTWIARQFLSDLSLAAPSAVADLYDIFANWTGSAIALSASGYNTYTLGSGPVSTNTGSTSIAAAAVTISSGISSTANILPNDVITISNGTTWEDIWVQSVNTNISLTVDWLSNTYGAASILHTRTPIQALTTQDGVLVMASDKSKRYLGTVLVVNNQFTDSGSKRLVANHYNRIPKFIAASNPAAYAASANVNIPWGGYALASKLYGTGRILYVTSPYGSPVRVTTARGYNASVLGLGYPQFDSVTNGNGPNFQNYVATSLVANQGAQGNFETSVNGVGLHFVQDMGWMGSGGTFTNVLASVNGVTPSLCWTMGEILQ